MTSGGQFRRGVIRSRGRFRSTRSRAAGAPRGSRGGRPSSTGTRPPFRQGVHVTFDERELGALITESEDLQSEARAQARESLPILEELHHERGDVRPGPQERRAFDQSRRSLLARLGLAGTGAAVGGTGIGAAVAAILSRPAAADKALDVQILQTASSLEKLAVATYGAALTLPFIKTGNKVVVTFAETTMKQHDEHKKAFQAQTTKLGGTVQDSPNPKYAPVVEAAKP